MGLLSRDNEREEKLERPEHTSKKSENSSQRGRGQKWCSWRMEEYGSKRRRKDVSEKEGEREGRDLAATVRRGTLGTHSPRVRERERESK